MSDLGLGRKQRMRKLACVSIAGVCIATLEMARRFRRRGPHYTVNIVPNATGMTEPATDRWPRSSQ